MSGSAVTLFVAGVFVDSAQTHLDNDMSVQSCKAVECDLTDIGNNISFFSPNWRSEQGHDISTDIQPVRTELNAGSLETDLNNSLITGLKLNPTVN